MSQGARLFIVDHIEQLFSAVGRLPELNVYGFDYPTKDDTAVRDYIHVMDLADGHIAALGNFFAAEDIGCVAYNLGTGCGTSVLEMVAAFEKAVGKSEVWHRGDVQRSMEVGKQESIWLQIQTLKVIETLNLIWFP